jgi:hypothetical protein
MHHISKYLLMVTLQYISIGFIKTYLCGDTRSHTGDVMMQPALQSVGCLSRVEQYNMRNEWIERFFDHPVYSWLSISRRLTQEVTIWKEGGGSISRLRSDGDMTRVSFNKMLGR